MGRHLLAEGRKTIGHHDAADCVLSFNKTDGAITDSIRTTCNMSPKHNVVHI